MNRNRAAAFGRAVVGVAVLVGVSTAQAVLGAADSSIQDDLTRMNGVRRHALAVHPLVSMHAISLSDGSSIREYVTPAGIVFAVAWSTRFKPNLQALLGQHAASFDAAASAALRSPGIKRQVILKHGDLVAHSAGHLNAFVGQAYLASLVPEGVHVEDLR